MARLRSASDVKGSKKECWEAERTIVATLTAQLTEVTNERDALKAENEVFADLVDQIKALRAQLTEARAENDGATQRMMRAMLLRDAAEAENTRIHAAIKRLQGCYGVPDWIQHDLRLALAPKSPPH